MKHILEHNKVCAILRGIPLDITVEYGKAAFEGGIRVFEVAMNSQDAVKQIEALRSYFGDRIWVGAGTVISSTRCEEAKAAGAQFFLTPSAGTGTMEFCRKYDIPLLPGVLTPTDVAVCLDYGYSIMKLFPAGDMPPSYIKSLKGPFDGTEYVAVGGVRPDNVRTFLDLGYIGVGIGSNLVPAELVKKRAWDEAADFIKSYTKSIFMTDGAGISAKEYKTEERKSKLS